MLGNLEENDLLCPHQSEFRSSDSLQSQLLSTFEGRSNVLDISKVFDKVWPKGLLFQLERIGI